MTLREKLDRLADLHDGWDSYGSPAITETALRAARNVVEAIPGAELTPCDVTVRVLPVPGGGIQFEVNHPNAYLELEILPDGRTRILNEAIILPEDGPRLVAEFVRLA